MRMRLNEPRQDRHPRMVLDGEVRVLGRKLGARANPANYCVGDNNRWVDDDVRSRRLERPIRGNHAVRRGVRSVKSAGRLPWRRHISPLMVVVEVARARISSCAPPAHMCQVVDIYGSINANGFLRVRRFFTLEAQGR